MKTLDKTLKSLKRHMSQEKLEDEEEMISREDYEELLAEQDSNLPK